MLFSNKPNDSEQFRGTAFFAQVGAITQHVDRVCSGELKPLEQSALPTIFRTQSADEKR